MRDFVYRGSDGCNLHATALGQGPVLILLDSGGPGRLLPLARNLAGGFTVILPDIHGYGRSVCADPERHIWAQHTEDVGTLLDHLGLRRAALGGTGLGGTITLRAAATLPDRIRAAIVISMEDIEGDAAEEAAETEMLEDFTARVRELGVHAAWDLPLSAPIISSLVREVLPVSGTASIAASCAFGRDQAFTQVHELAAITVPTLVIPGADTRHPAAVAAQTARILPHGHLSDVSVSADLDTAAALAPTIWDFLTTHLTLYSAGPGRPGTR
ncbi:alpha/beta fold hydrolase [Streptomyces sp. NPDC091290]|uniref:alpha/beta fold hydrolase n=1 Tax=Streptomyces sp. NPDC091290 TaxID=3365990 RepID=UPI0037FAEEC7